MAEVFKILSQVNPAATTSTDMYTVPASTNTTVSSIVVCNQSATAGTFRISVATAGAAIAPQHYLYYDHPIDGNTSFVLTIGITLSATDKVRVYSSSASMSFNAFGVEVS